MRGMLFGSIFVSLVSGSAHAAQDASAQPASEPIAAKFDLASHSRASPRNMVASDDGMLPDIRIPRNMIVGERAPSVEYRTSPDGVVIAAGALGRNGRDVPRLAHIRLGWEF